ncbi:hypothetical protein, partial [Salmonella enterica]
AVKLGLWRLWAEPKNSDTTTPVAKAGGQIAAL